MRQVPKPGVSMNCHPPAAHDRPGPTPSRTCPGCLPARTHLCALVSLVYEPPEVKHHVPGEGLQLLRSHVRDLQPLQVEHVLLVVGHLRGHRGGLQRPGKGAAARVLGTATSHSHTGRGIQATLCS